MVFGHPANETFLADQQSCLRAAENLIAAEGHNIGAGIDPLGNDRFFRQAVAAEIDESAAAQILHHRDTVFFAYRDELRQFDFGGKPDDLIVTRMYFQQQSRLLADGFFVVFRMGTVGAADFF